MSDGLYHGGMPTGPDIKRLNDQWPDLKAGDKIPYIEIAKVIVCNRSDNRFTTIIEAWKKDLKERKLILERIRGQGVIILTDAETIDMTPKSIRSAENSLHRQQERLQSISPKNPVEKGKRDHCLNLLIHMRKDLSEGKEKITAPHLIPLPQRQLANDGKIPKKK